MAPQPISTAYFTNPSRQSVSVCVISYRCQATAIKDVNMEANPLILTVIPVWCRTGHSLLEIKEPVGAHESGSP
jgi:hypothetical protein